MDVPDVVIGQTHRVKDTIGDKVQKRFRDFLNEYNDDLENEESKYYEEALNLAKPERNTLFVSFKDVEKYDQNLSTIILEDFYHLYPFICRSLAGFVKSSIMKSENLDENDKTKKESAQAIFNVLDSKDFFVGFYNISRAIKLRDLKATKVGSLRRVSGQVVRTHAVHPELISGTFECLDCQTVIPNVEQQFKFTEPTICRNTLCSNRSRFKLLLHRSRFVDFQKIRIQETQNELPRGCMPRGLDIIIRGADQVECIQAGEKCDFVGCLIVVPDIAQMFAAQAGSVRTDSSNRNGISGDGVSGLKSLGVKEMTYKLAFLSNCCIREGSKIPATWEELKAAASEDAKVRDLSMFTEADLHQIHQMAKDKKIVDNIVRSLFPSIYGNDEIKKGVLLQLFGGVGKTTEEGTSLRGDINICLVGDPSTAKSQFLKLVTDFGLTKTVYTSGKASTASGLTAAVVRDDNGGFVVEPGALMLADQGICCIDEFDKMDIKDQVAIHEAMEQQTLSITKAGVKATLNARTSILAAANPIGGTYDRTRTLRNNLSLSLPIMSRFDLFFVVLDECNEVTDYAIAKRIVDLHTEAFNVVREREQVHYKLEDIKKYIQFARSFKPKLAETAENEIVEVYKELRLNGGSSGGGFNGSDRQAWRITVRQLESLIRLSEALAKLYCCDQVDVCHVQEAARLLNRSIVKIEQPDVELVSEMIDEQDIEPVEEEASQTTEARAAQAQAAKVPYETYRRMANSFVIYLRSLEGKELVKKSQLVFWYLQECEDIENTEELASEKILCEKVIQHLIDPDHILIRKLDEEDFDIEDPYLMVHPNYILDDL